MHDILWIIGIGIASYLITAIVGQWRKKGFPDFDSWWHGEGVVFFGVTLVVIAIIACGVGVFQFKVWN